MSDFTLSYPLQQIRYEYPRIVAAAQALYLERGFEAVALADIAVNLRVPVGAIEQHFPVGKPALVQAVLENYLEYLHQTMRQQRDDSSNAVEELLALRRFLQQTMSTTRTLLFQELRAHYPSVWEYAQRVRTAFTLELLQANMRRGIREGFYRPDLAIADQAQQWLHQSDARLATIHSVSELADTSYTQLSQFLASLTTPAGSYAIRRLQEAPPYY